ncbi:hypothetical protein TNCV_2767821 [Trichonephila clavipes]|nr:hypothetical protein TNCV_2767821 [Trichonephila clavipes]
MKNEFRGIHLTRSPTPSPMERKYRRFVLLDESFNLGSGNSPLVSMEIPLRTAYGQNGRCGMQPKARQFSRAGAANQNQKQKLLDIRAEKEEKGERDEVREQALPSEYHRQTYL